MPKVIADHTTAALAAPGDDRELLRICNEFHQLLRIDDALPTTSKHSSCCAISARRRPTVS